LPETPKLDLGVEQVLSALLDDENMKWIRGSALTERAFLIGASKFAEAIFPDQENKLLRFAIMGTLWGRESDDPFLISEAGKLYSEFRDGMESYCSSAIRNESAFDFPEETLNSVSGLVERLSELQHTQESNREKAIDMIYGNSRSLEEPLRFLSGSQAAKN
jgi:hypothetical protein